MDIQNTSPLERLENETEYEYHKRLIYGKLVDKTLTDYDYTEIAPLIYGKEYSCDVARRMLYGSCKTLQLIDRLDEECLKTSDTAEMIKLLEQKKEELQRERYKIQATNLERQRYGRQDSRFELFYENVRDAIERLPVPTFRPLCESQEDETPKQWVLGFGDFHFGAKFKSVNNTYSIEECESRLEDLVDRLYNVVVREGISRLKVVNVADTIQGILRITDLKLNEIAVVESVVQISRLLATFINRVSEYCEVEYYHCTHANHSQTRPLGTKASELATEDLEKVIANYTADLLRDNPRVRCIFDCSQDYLEFKIFDFNFVVLHGHQIRSVDDTIKDLSNRHRKFYDYAFLGHRHAANEVITGEGKHHNVEVLTLPSFVGSDPYSDRLMRGAKAMVKLYEFDSVYGHISSKSIILN